MLTFLYLPNIENKLDSVVSPINLNEMRYWNVEIAQQFIELAIVSN